MVTTFAERTHEKTNNFHLLDGEMPITLDDVMCHLHIPTEGKMMDHDEAISYEKGLELMTDMLGVFEKEAVEETWKHWGRYVGPHS